VAFSLSLVVTAKKYRSLNPEEQLESQYRKSSYGSFVQMTRSLEGLVFISLLCFRLSKPNDSTTISYPVLFLPVWIATVLKAVLTQRGNANPENPDSNGVWSLVVAVASDIEFFIALFLYTKLTEASDLQWAGTFSPFWVLVACGFVLSCVIFGVLCYLWFHPDAGETFGFGGDLLFISHFCFFSIQSCWRRVHVLGIVSIIFFVIIF
jgi:hypothetical protein